MSRILDAGPAKVETAKPFTGRGLVAKGLSGVHAAKDSRSIASWVRPPMGRKVRSHHNHNVSGLGSAWQTPATGFVR